MMMLVVLHKGNILSLRTGWQPTNTTSQSGVPLGVISIKIYKDRWKLVAWTDFHYGSTSCWLEQRESV